MKFVTGLMVVLISGSVFAHGEDKPGPNGGHIQMPGTFHTEVVPEKDGSYKIFLLNLQNEAPTTKNSSVKATIVTGKKKQKLSCTEMGDHFHCYAKGGNKSGTLVIMAKRDGAVGIEAKYKLPLKNNAKVLSPQGHEGHH